MGKQSELFPMKKVNLVKIQLKIVVKKIWTSLIHRGARTWSPLIVM